LTKAAYASSLNPEKFGSAPYSVVANVIAGSSWPHADGDPEGDTPAAFEVAAGALKVVVSAIRLGDPALGAAELLRLAGR
jgi:hypothetical protein